MQGVAGGCRVLTDDCMCVYYCNVLPWGGRRVLTDDCMCVYYCNVLPWGGAGSLSPCKSGSRGRRTAEHTSISCASARRT